MTYSRFEVADDVLRVWGDSDALEVSFAHEGVARVRSAPRARANHVSFPKLPRKESFAVLGGERQRLSVDDDEGRLTASGGGLTFTLSLAAGTWTVTDADGHVLAELVAVSGDPASLLHKSTFSLAAPKGAAYLGFGEKVGPMDKRGMRFTFWNTDAFQHHTDSDPLYVSIPFATVLHQGRATGLFLDESWRSEVDVARERTDRLTWTSAGPELDLYVIAGPTPADVLRRYTDLTGRHLLPPLWSLGAAQSRWGYESAADVRAVIEGYRSRNLPLDAVYVDIDYMDAYKVFTWDKTRFPDPADLCDEALTRGVRLVPIIDPGVKVEPGYRVYEEGKALDAFVRDSRGDVLVGEVWPNPAVWPDFTREDVREWWAGYFRDLVDVGIAGVWNDMNEPAAFSIRGSGSHLGEIERSRGSIEGKTLPYDARHGTRRHLEVHNAYALGMNNAARRGFGAALPNHRPFLVSRSAFAGIQRDSAVWSGDNTSAWSHLELSVTMLCGLGMSGVGHVGADVGGFLGHSAPELLQRWYQLGAFYPMMRNHCVVDGRDQEPWRFGEDTVEVVRSALTLRYRLLPLLYTLMHDLTRTGLPPMRPLALHHPQDVRAVRCDTQFLFGEDVLVAPVTRAGHDARLAYLPEGRWLSFANFERIGATFGGQADVTVSADEHTVPVFLRAGGAVALTEPALHTTTANWRHLTWHVHAAETIRGHLYEDAGDGYGEARETRLSGAVRDGALRLHRAAAGRLALDRTTETIVVYGLERVSRVDGAQRWSFENGALHLTVGATWSEVSVEP